MKKKILMVLFFATLVVFMGCKKDDDNSENDTTTLEGTWHLRNVAGGFTGVDIDFDRGDVVWIFTTAGSTLVVENNLDTSDPNYTYPGLESGTYGYETMEVDGKEVLVVDGLEQGEIILTATSLKLDEQPSDGFLRTFER